MKRLEKPYIAFHDTRMTDTKATVLYRKLYAHAPLITVSAIAGLVLTFLAPFGTHQFHFAWRLFYWTSLCIAGGLGTLIYGFVEKALGLKNKSWRKAIGQSLGATLFVAVFIFGLYGFHSLQSTLITLFDIWLISIVLCGLSVFFEHRSRDNRQDAERPRLYQRLSPNLRQAEIFALSSEDHYVRVYTSLGEDLLLMRLSDAINEVSALHGLSPHRSWWVSEAGVEKVNRQNGKISLLLKNGLSVPVSRNGAKKIKTAGWL